MMTPPGQAMQTPGQMQNLKSALGGTSLPTNPNTPADRTDPQERTTLDLQRIRRALERATQPYDGGPSGASTDILRMMHGVVTRIIGGTDPTEAMMVAVQTLIPSLKPQGATPGIAAPGAPAGPPQAPPPSLLAGIPGLGPVSPGSGGPPMGGPPTPMPG